MECTTDFRKFGYREREMAEELLKASREQGFPINFEEDEIEIMFNPDSGCVFFTNADYQVAMMNESFLERFYTLPHSGEEGFADELRDLDTKELSYIDVKYLRDHMIIPLE